jgi:hypothetical protein
MTPKSPTNEGPDNGLNDGRPYARDLGGQGGDLSAGFARLALRLGSTVATVGLAYGAFRLFDGAGLYVFALLFAAWWLHRELKWIERNIPPED